MEQKVPGVKLNFCSSVALGILKEMGLPDHLTCLLRNLYAGQKGTVRTGHGTTDWLQIGKRERQGCILSPCLFNILFLHIKKSEVVRSCPTLCDPMDCSLPGSSIHGIFQARVLEWGAIALLAYVKQMTSGKLKRWAGRSTSWNQNCWEKYQ